MRCRPTTAAVEARSACSTGRSVGRGIIDDEMHRPAQHHAPVCRAQGLGGALAQHDRELGDAVLQQGATQQALERTHQPALGAGQVLDHGIAAQVGAVVFGVVEHGGGRGQRITFQRDQACLATGVGPGHGRIGGVEVYAQRAV